MHTKLNLFAQEQTKKWKLRTRYKERRFTIMAGYVKSTLDLIGNTPLMEVTNIEKELGLEAKVLVKLEYFNPAEA